MGHEAWAHTVAAAQQWMPCTVLEVNTDAAAASFLFVFTQQTIAHPSLPVVYLVAVGGVVVVVLLWDLQGLFDLAQPRCYFAVFVSSSHCPPFWACLSYVWTALRN